LKGEPRLLGPWDGALLVRWTASPYLRRIPPPEPDAFFLWYPDDHPWAMVALLAAASESA
jgi:hypothetical protein